MDLLFHSSSYGSQPTPYNLLLLQQLYAATHRNHVRWDETPESHIFSANIPGVRRDDVRVEVEDSRYLVIRTETAAAATEGDEQPGWSNRSFMRKFRLPEQIELEGISARFSEGVLRVTVPRITAARRRRMLMRLGLEAASVQDETSSGSAPAA